MTTLEANRALTALDDLLVEYFSSSELVRLIERSLGPAVLADLPVSAESPRLFMYHAIRVLHRQRLLTAPFFEALAAVRPALRAALPGVAPALAGPDCIDVHVVPPDDPGVSRRALVEALEQHLLARERLPASDDHSVAREATIDALARRIRDVPLLTPGSVVATTRLEQILGVGTFGTVWRARHISTGHPVATKVFHLDRLTDGVMLWRFRRSIRALLTINRYRDRPASIPPFLAESPDSLAFVMPYYADGTLERIEQRGWSLATKIAVFLEVCAAVRFAHRVGVIHRDIKPANVLLDAGHHPVLVDYDIADISFVTQLADGQGGLGTPVFAAPEQLEDAAASDERSDIYSLGRLLHYLLLERTPGYQIERDPALDNLRGFHPALVAAIRRATQWDPRRRHPTVEALVADVERYKTGYAALRARCSATGRWVRRHAALLSICAIVTGASMAIAAARTELAETQRRTLDFVREATSRNDARITELTATYARVDRFAADLAVLQQLADRFAHIPETAALASSLDELTRALAPIRKALYANTSALANEQSHLHTTLETQRSSVEPIMLEFPTSEPHVAPRRIVPAIESAQLREPSPSKVRPASQAVRRPKTVKFVEVLEQNNDSLFACVTRSVYEDRARPLTIRLNIKSSGTVVSCVPLRKLQDATRDCICDAVRKLNLGKNKSGEIYDHSIIP